METPTFFLSYARSDSEFALKLARELREAGANLWVDQFDISAGDRWDRAVHIALKASPCLLVILSPAAVASENVMDEVSFALDKEKKIVPVLYRDCDIPLRLTRVQRLDFTTEYDRAFEELLKSLTVGETSARDPVSDEAKEQTKRATLTPSFDKGLYGGLIGGALAGLITGVFYYLGSYETDAEGDEVGIPLVFMILGYGAVVGATFGICTQQAIQAFRRAVLERRSVGVFFKESEIIGGILGGGLAGILAGGLGGWWFGDLSIPFIDPILLMTGSLLGMLCIVLGVLLYDYKRRWRDVLRALILATVVSAFFASFGVGLLHFLDAGEYFTFAATRAMNVQGGAMIGFVVLLVLGLLFGLTLRLYAGKPT